MESGWWRTFPLEEDLLCCFQVLTYREFLALRYKFQKIGVCKRNSDKNLNYSIAKGSAAINGMTCKIKC